MNAPSSPIRSPSHKASGQQSGPVRVQRLGLTAFLSISRRPAEADCRPPLCRREKVHLWSVRFADLALDCLRAIGQACRPEPSSSLSDGLFMGETFPGRVIVLVTCVNPLPAQCTTLRWRPQETTAESARADRVWPETDNEKRG